MTEELEQCRVEARLEDDSDRWLFCGNMTHIKAAAECARSRGIADGIVLTRDRSRPDLIYKNRVHLVIRYEVTPLRGDDDDSCQGEVEAVGEEGACFAEVVTRDPSVLRQSGQRKQDDRGDDSQE